ncbi:ribonuclease III [Candidatus Nomurabacteria bacterium]|nr:ribonuclease III [Candidatus Nomurabacteria bacterium]
MNWQQEFKNPDLLREAFTHRSYLNEHPEINLSHNERLEFLGDAVLELVTTEYLYTKYQDANEGELTAYRAALVNTETLSAVAREAGMNDYLLLSRGELRDTGRARSVILANTFEAVLGAIFLDRGYLAVRDFLDHYLFPKTDKIVKEALWQDAKSLFQEKAQSVSGVTPDYRVLGEVGPDHDKIFTVGLYLNKEQISTGTGPSKQRAEQEAARLGLIIKEWNN